MANLEQLELLKAGIADWNEWRRENRTGIDLLGVDLSGYDLRGVDLSRTDLRGAKFIASNLCGANLSRAGLALSDLRGANLSSAKLSGAYLHSADLSGANLSGADLSLVNLSDAKFHGADLNGTDLSGADLRGVHLLKASEFDIGAAKTFYGVDISGVTNFSSAILRRADLRGVDLSGIKLVRVDLTESNLSGARLIDVDLSDANLTGANLSDADLRGATLRGADLTSANLIYSNLTKADISSSKISRSKVYGVNVWDLNGDFREQKELVITPEGESAITVDNIKIAQFVYLILNNKEIRDVINTLTSKTVLILGRFSPERKAILDALRNKLREFDLLPIIFDFDRPVDKDTTETINTLASISYFVIADVTSPRSSPLELQALVPEYQIPFVPIIQEDELPFSMMEDLRTKHHWVLTPISYNSVDELINIIKIGIIDPAIDKHNELRIIKARKPTVILARDILSKK